MANRNTLFGQLSSASAHQVGVRACFTDNKAKAIDQMRLKWVVRLTIVNFTDENEYAGTRFEIVEVPYFFESSHVDASGMFKHGCDSMPFIYGAASVSRSEHYVSAILVPRVDLSEFDL